MIDQSPSQHASEYKDLVEPALSPLHSFHALAGAKMADFGGWMMPIEYPSPAGVLAEHNAARNSVALFDVSHLGKISISKNSKAGSVIDFLNSVVSSDLRTIEDGGAQYTLLCDAQGGVTDDLIVYQISSAELFLVPNAANCQKVFEILASLAPDDIEVTNRHHEFGVIAVQGPLSREVLQSIGLPTDFDYMSFSKSEIKSREVIICRSGYTGELGFEIIAPCADGDSLFFQELWSDLAKQVRERQGLVAGLGARDTLRTEMGYPLHGQELSAHINPIEAGAKWALALGKENFLGKSALESYLKESKRRKSFAIKSLDRGIPRKGMEVIKDGEVVGVVTSGTFSPSLKIGIGLALLDMAEEEFKIGDHLEIDIRGRKSEIELVKLPFLASKVRS